MKAKRLQTAVHIVRTVLLVAFFYAFSISLTFYNKWLVKRFHFPLTVSVAHYTFVFLSATVIRRIWEFYYKKKRIILDWDSYARRCFVPAIASSLDIGLSNWSFMFITVSLYTMTKSTSIVFILLFAIVFKLERLRLSIVGVVALISLGLFMFTYESTQFNLTGFIIALSSSFLSGIRWTTIQLLMQKEKSGLSNPFDAIYHLQPVMATALVPLAIFIEGPSMASSRQLLLASSWSEIAVTLSRVFVGAFLALMLTISEYLLVSYTSGLGLAVAGILKEICTLSIASEFGGDQLNALNFVGLIVCMSGISLHIFSKATQDHSNEKSQVNTKEYSRHDEGIPMLDMYGSDEEENIFSAKL